MNQFEQNSLYKLKCDCEKLLLFGAAGLMLFHMIISSYKNALPRRWFFRHADEWLGLMLLFAVLTYLIIVCFASPSTRIRYKQVILNFNVYEYWFSFFLVFWYVISCLMRQYMTGNTSFKDNDWWLFITWLMSFVVFPFARATGVKQARKYFAPMLRIVLIPHIIFFAWLLWNYFHKHYVTFPSGNSLEMIPGSASLAAGENRNNTAATALTMMGLCWYMLASRKTLRKLPYIFGIAVYMSVLILTNSRTSWYAGLVMISLIIFRFVWGVLRKGSQGLRILTGLVCVVACISLLLELRGEMFELLDRATNFTGNSPTTEHLATQKSAQEAEFFTINLTRKAGPNQNAATSSLIRFTESGIYLEKTTAAPDYARGTERGLNGRKEIYLACLHVMLSRKYIFMFGVTHADVGKAIYNVCGVKTIYPDAHNYWLQMGLAFGVPMMLASIVFSVFLALRCLRVLFREKEDFSGAWTVPVLVLSTLVFELAETQISAGSLVVCPAFYLFAGWVVAMDLEWKEQKKTDVTESVPA